MAWEARSGLKHPCVGTRASVLNGLNGLGSPFGIETCLPQYQHLVGLRLNGLGSPFGIETIAVL